jgi:hypothetical protein
MSDQTRKTAPETTFEQLWATLQDTVCIAEPPEARQPKAW